MLQSNNILSTVRCRLAAAGVVRADASSILAWRKQPPAFGPEPVTASFLKHADDQTVVAVQAVRVALESFEGARPDFRDWGVIAGPNFFGRSLNARAMQAYPTDGAWGVSPHLIPHQSLHAISGTLSQLLKIHGPNFGVGGGPNAAPDTLLLAGSLLADGTLPGLWLILTGYESEWIPTEDLATSPAPECRGLALALAPMAETDCVPALSFRTSSDEGMSDWLPELHLNLLAEAIADRQRGTWRLGGSVVVELDAVSGEERG